MSTATRESRTFDVACKAAEILEGHGVKCAVIGAIAAAIRGYPRATEDFDLATTTDPFRVLTAVESELRALGYSAELNTPDHDDPLGGVLTISGEEFNPVQIVNFHNPFRPEAGRVGTDAIETAETNVLGPLAVVDLAHLVALKLYAGGAKSRLDVVELVERNPDASLGAIGAVCRAHGLETEWADLLRSMGR